MWINTGWLRYCQNSEMEQKFDELMEAVCNLKLDMEDKLSSSIAELK